MDTEPKKYILPVLPWNQGADLTWFEYRSGYKKAADALTRNLIDNKKVVVDERFGMVYPIMFLYRHYIELEFKDVLAIFGMTSLVSKKTNLGHDLEALWLKMLQCVEAVHGVNARREVTEAFEIVVAFFVKLDPRGDRFRYPKSAKGKSQWNNSFQIDVVAVAAKVNRLEQCCYELRSELMQMIDPEATDVGDRCYLY